MDYECCISCPQFPEFRYGENTYFHHASPGTGTLTKTIYVELQQLSQPRRFYVRYARAVSSRPSAGGSWNQTLSIKQLCETNQPSADTRP